MGSRYAFAFQGLCASRNWLLHGSHQAFDSTEKRPGDFRKKNMPMQPETFYECG